MTLHLLLLNYLLAVRVLGILRGKFSCAWFLRFDLGATCRDLNPVDDEMDALELELRSALKKTFTFSRLEI